MIEPYGYLSNYSNAVTPNLLNLVMQNETGHLSMKDRFDPIKSRSSKDAYGGYQLREKHLHDLGYKLPPYTKEDALDPIKSRDIAGKFIEGYSDHYKFSNLAETLIGYNMGAKATSDWKSRGSNWDELPEETKQYLTRASSIIKKNPEQYNIPELINDDNENIKQEGSSDMNTYTPNAFKQRKALNFINGRYYDGGDPYSEGFEHYGTPNEKTAGVLDNEFINDLKMKIKANAGILNASTNDNAIDTSLLTGGGGDLSADPSFGKDKTLITKENLAETILKNRNLAEEGILNGEGADIYSEGSDRYGDLYGSGISSKPSNGYLTQPEAKTMKRRDSQDLSKGVKYPEDIGLSEMLIRIGGAGLKNSHLGGNRQMSDATGMYGNIMDFNRGQGLEKYKTDMANAKRTAKQARADSDYLGNIDQSLVDMDKALMGLKDGGVTGLWDGTVGSFIDGMTGNPKETTRLLLQKLKVDDTLLRIAQTKGAISNKEMDLFMSPAPKVGFHDEEVWKRWINERKVALQRIKARLTGGRQVIQGEQATKSQVGTFNKYGVTVKRL